MKPKNRFYPTCTFLSRSLCLMIHGFCPAADSPEINCHMGMAQYKNSDNEKLRMEG
jgi:hypothetical protein